MEEDGDENFHSPEESAKSPTVLPWDRFSNWLHCACVVTFDLELGQAMEVSKINLICDGTTSIFVEINLTVYLHIFMFVFVI